MSKWSDFEETEHLFDFIKVATLFDIYDTNYINIREKKENLRRILTEESSEELIEIRVTSTELGELVEVDSVGMDHIYRILQLCIGIYNTMKVHCREPVVIHRWDLMGRDISKGARELEEVFCNHFIHHLEIRRDHTGRGLDKPCFDTQVLLETPSAWHIDYGHILARLVTMDRENSSDIQRDS